MKGEGDDIPMKMAGANLPIIWPEEYQPGERTAADPVDGGSRRAEPARAVRSSWGERPGD